MIKLHKIAGNMMAYLEAFDGSRAALDSSKILIVRGRSKKRMDPQMMNDELNGLISSMDAQEIDMFSEEAASLIGVMDEQIRSEVDINTDTDAGGIQTLKESLESMNFFVEYKLGYLKNAGFFIVLYKDKSGVGPCFTEIVISDTGD